MKDSSFNGSVSLTLRATRCPCGPWPSKTPQKVVSSLIKSYKDSMHKDIDLQMKIKDHLGEKLTSQTIMASWFIPLRPCWVNIQELRLFPLVKIRLGMEDKCFNILMWSENFFLPPHEISKQDGLTVSPLLLLLELLWLLVETQHPI